MINKQNGRNELVGILTTLKEAREKLLIDFLNRDPLIFIPIFRYEKNPTTMNIAMENYFISWINYHFHIWEKYINSKVSKKMFLKTMDLFFFKYLGGVKKDRFPDPVFINDLLERKRRILQKLLEAENKDTTHYNTLMMEYEKDKALFQRQIKLIS